MVMRKGIEKAVAVTVEAIKANAEVVKGSDDIARVGAVSSGDETVGKLIAEAMEKVSTSGVITIEESKTAETGLEVACSSTAATSLRTWSPIPRRWKLSSTIRIS